VTVYTAGTQFGKKRQYALYLWTRGPRNPGYPRDILICPRIEYTLYTETSFYFRV